MKSFEPFDITLTRRKNGDYYGVFPGKRAKRRFCKRDLHEYFSFPYGIDTIHLHITPRKAYSRYRAVIKPSWWSDHGIGITLYGNHETHPNFYDGTRRSVKNLLTKLEEDGYEVYVGLELDR